MRPEANVPHAPGVVLQAGSPLNEAEGLVILLHGRGGSAEDILALYPLMTPELTGLRLAWLAPEAHGHAWYPNSFLAPRESNEPGLSSAFGRIAALIEEGGRNGLGTERIVVAGFSQGACLSTEFVASHPARYAGLIAFTGGLIGPPGMAMDYAGDLAGTPALLLSGDPDPHVPWARVEESAAVLIRMGAKVTLRRYPGRPHTVSREEIELGKQLIADAFRGMPAKA
jgi:phospholipase/carboxylesterase